MLPFALCCSLSTKLFSYLSWSVSIVVGHVLGFASHSHMAHPYTDQGASIGRIDNLFDAELIRCAYRIL